MTLTDNVKLWVAALKSGEFKQGINKLQRHNSHTGEISYCCLGVACVIYERVTGLKVPELQTNNYLPEDVQSWLGLTTHAGGYDRTSLANKNDDMTTFSQIAEIIESEPEGLFSTTRA